MIYIFLIALIFFAPVKVSLSSEPASQLNEIKPSSENLATTKALSPSKNFKYVDPKSKNEETSWEYTPPGKDSVSLGYRDKIKNKLKKEKKTAESWSYQKQQAGIKIKKEDLKYKPSSVVESQFVEDKTKTKQ